MWYLFAWFGMVYDNFDGRIGGGVGTTTKFDDREASTERLLRALAVVEDARITELDPLYESIEPEALFELLRHADDHDCIVGVEFVHGDFTVSITGSGSIRIHDRAPKIARSREKPD